MLSVLMPAFLRSLISRGRLFLNSGVLSEEALPPAVATLGVWSGVACVCLSASSSLSHSSSPFPLPLRLPQHNKESPLFSSSPDQSHLFTLFLLKSCLCLSLLCVPLSLILHLSLAPVLFSLFLSLSLSHRPLLPLTDSVINWFSARCVPSVSL